MTAQQEEMMSAQSALQRLTQIADEVEALITEELDSDSECEELSGP